MGEVGGDVPDVDPMGVDGGAIDGGAGLGGAIGSGGKTGAGGYQGTGGAAGLGGMTGAGGAGPATDYPRCPPTGAVNKGIDCGRMMTGPTGIRHSCSVCYEGWDTSTLPCIGAGLCVADCNLCGG